MFALVSTDGRYHGHLASADEARRLDAVKAATAGYMRLLSEKEWQQVAANRERRAELCSTLGAAV